MDNEFTIPILEYPKELQGINQRQVLRAYEYLIEEDGEIDQSKLYKVFTHPIYGDIYTTRPELNPIRSFELEGLLSDGIEWCQGTGCFTTNQFFAFRPDGTSLKFSYKPDISVENITWTDNKKTNSDYVSYTLAGCDRFDDVSVVSPTLVNENDLVPIGRENNTGDIVYGLKDENHKLYTEFYNAYNQYFGGQYIYPEEKNQIKSYRDFINSRPIFLWRDPFNRLIRFNNNEFLPPLACEPIIYLYPQTTQKVSITFDPIVNISDSTPKYQNAWNVVAEPKGKILNLSDNKVYPYLFWEGWSLIFPIQSKGFIVKKEDVPNFLSEILSKLGLNEKEKTDFMQAWLPSFSGSPYYFITFLDQSTINKIAPLRISPKPDTLIRILMDFKPLEKPVTVEKLEFRPIPQRDGFTVVEWGGLRR